MAEGIIEIDWYVEPTDSHQYYLLSFSHPFCCEKGISHNQALTLNRTCSNNKFFDKWCGDFEEYLERCCFGRIVHNEILRSRAILRDGQLEKSNNQKKRQQN